MSTLTEKPKRHRRLPRWSMRAMFVGITIVCVVMGLVVRPAEEQRRAVAALRALDDVPYGYKEARVSDFDRYQRGIKIIYDYEIGVKDGDSRWVEKTYSPPPGPKWLRELIGIDYFADVVTIALIGPSIGDDDLGRLRHFQKLESLHVSHCDGITDVGLGHLGTLTSLVELNLERNKFTTIPPEIGKLKKLTELNLEHNQLTALPPEFWALTKLAELDLGENEFTTLPPEIGNLTKLTSLSVSSNHLVKLPPEIGHLKNLDVLSLSFNELTTLPTEIRQLTKLTGLGFSFNNFTRFPPEIWQLTKLTWLDISDNQLATLPSEIGKLTNLTHLHLGDNQFTTLPPEIGKLTKMETLDLRSNDFADADLKHLKSLKNLGILYVYDTKVTKQGVIDLMRALPNCAIYSNFRSLPDSEPLTAPSN